MHFFYKRSHSIILNPHNTTFLPLRPQKNLSQPSITIIFSYYSPLYIWIEAIVFLTLLIFSPFTKKRSPFTLCPITVPEDFWGLNTGCDHSIPTRRLLFTLSPITAAPNFFRGGLTIDRWTWYPDNGNLCNFFTNAHTPLYSTLIIPHFYHFDHKKYLSQPSITIIFSYYSPLYTCIEGLRQLYF